MALTRGILLSQSRTSISKRSWLVAEVVFLFLVLYAVGVFLTQSVTDYKVALAKESQARFAGTRSMFQQYQGRLVSAPACSSRFAGQPDRYLRSWRATSGRSQAQCLPCFKLPPECMERSGGKESKAAVCQRACGMPYPLGRCHPLVEDACHSYSASTSGTCQKRYNTRFLGLDLSSKTRVEERIGCLVSLIIPESHFGAYIRPARLSFWTAFLMLARAELGMCPS